MRESCASILAKALIWRVGLLLEGTGNGFPG